MYTLVLLTANLAVCRLNVDEPFPAWAVGELVSIVRTQDELSVVCECASVPADVKAESGWRALKVQGPLDFSLIGVLAELSGLLMGAGVSLFAISTYDTDYLLVKNGVLNDAIGALRRGGHCVLSSTD